MLYYSGLSRTLRQLRWVLYPRRCPFCDRVLGNQPACPDCADGLAELRRAPSMRLRGSEHYLGRLDGAAAPYRYTGLVRRAVLRAKYQGAPWAAVELGVEMARLLFGSEIRMCGSEPLPEPVPGLDRGYDCILPVPASSKKRGYNVPERMAQPLARAVGVPVVTDALTRARSTRRQEGLSLDERLANVAGAFRVARPEAVEGKRILLVDDVLTTGATASACAQALLDAGAQSVFAVARLNGVQEAVSSILATRIGTRPTISKEIVGLDFLFGCFWCAVPEGRAPLQGGRVYECCTAPGCGCDPSFQPERCSAG